MQRPAVQPGQVEVGLERVGLPTERVSPHRHVDRVQLMLVRPAVQDVGGKQDHPRARPERRHAPSQPLAQRFQQLERLQQPADRRRLPTRQHQPVDLRKLPGTPNRARPDTALLQRPQVLANVPLQRKHADLPPGVHVWPA